MAESLVTPSGDALDVTAVEQGERDFAKAMAAPPSGDMPAPPPDHGKDMPERPARRGRPPRAKSSEAKTAKPPVPVKADYSEDATKAVGTAWTLLASIPPTQSYALVLNNASEGLAAALAEGAKVNPTVRRWVSGGGSAGWQVQLGAVAVQMGMQSMQLMRDPELRKQCAEQTREQFANTVKLAKQETGTNEPGNV